MSHYPYIQAFLYTLIVALGQFSSCQAAILLQTNLSILSTNATEFFVKDNSSNAFVPLNFSDPALWKSSDFYKGLPIKQSDDARYEVDIAALTTQQFKDYFLIGESWANFTFTEESIEKVRASVLNKTTPLAKPQLKCRDSNNKRCFGYSPVCGDDVHYRYVSQTTGTNLDVWGYYHYKSDKICGPAGGSQGVSVTHQSGISIFGAATPATVGQGGALKYISKFLSVFGIGINGPAPDSVSISHTYSVKCEQYHVCFLYERPHLAVYLGNTHAFAHDPLYKIDCPDHNKRWNWSLHIPWAADSRHVQASWGQCESKNGHGCGWPPIAVAANLYCPDKDM